MQTRKHDALRVAGPFQSRSPVSVPFMTLRFSLLVLAVALAAPRADAQFLFIPYGGFDFDFDAALLGVAVEVPMPIAGLPVEVAVRPSAEYYFVGDVDQFNRTLVGINADLVASLSPPGSVGFFAGAGLGLAFASSDVPGAQTTSDFGLNLIGGAQFGTGFATPFAQGRITFGDGTRLAALAGVRFNL